MELLLFGDNILQLSSTDSDLKTGIQIIGYILKDDKKMMGQYLNFITAGFLNTKFKEDPKLEKFEYFILIKVCLRLKIYKHNMF